MRREIFSLFFLMLLLILFQLAIGDNLGFLAGKINLILVALVVLINLFDFGLVVVFAVGTGLILDVYSSLPFGVISLSLFLTAVFCELLFVNFFTNFSFYSLMILGFLAAVFYNVIFTLAVVGIYFIGLSDFLPKWNDLYALIWQIVGVEILMILAYYLVNSLSKRFKPIFLK